MLGQNISLLSFNISILKETFSLQHPPGLVLSLNVMTVEIGYGPTEVLLVDAGHPLLTDLSGQTNIAFFAMTYIRRFGHLSKFELLLIYNND